MGIPSLSTFAAGSPAAIADLQDNISKLDAYMKASIDGQDFTDKAQIRHGKPKSVHRVYRSSWEAGVSTEVDDTVSANTDEWELDRDAHLDFTAYGDVEGDFYDATEQTHIATPKEFVSRFVWEKLGNVPTANNDGTGAELKFNPHSWENWLFQSKDPIVDSPSMTGYEDGKDVAHRFPDDEYWDRWLTVPYACKRIYVPEKCILFVRGSAIGTWNHSLTAFRERDTQLIGDGNSAWDTGYDDTDEYPAMFRLFIDRDNDKEWRGFTWEVDGNQWYANWSPVQDSPLVGYETISGLDKRNEGVEISPSCSPRDTAFLASKILVPEAGWYNISFRYNARFWYGWNDTAENPDEWVNGWNAGGWNYHPGPICFARFESSSIAAMAHFNRTGTTSVDNDGEHD
jgi:hypothetical protein